jgi:hypothetical protein
VHRSHIAVLARAIEKKWGAVLKAPSPRPAEREREREKKKA